MRTEKPEIKAKGLPDSELIKKYESGKSNLGKVIKSTFKPSVAVKKPSKIK